MRLHLFRHGKAVPSEDPSVKRDAERPLTEEGQRQVKEAAQGIAALDIDPDRVLTSPYTRAQQTAKLAREAFEGAGEITEVHELRPKADPADTRQALAGLEDADDVVLCGHRPHLPNLASYLLTGEPRGLDIDFPKAALVTIDIPLGTPEALGTIEHLIPPQALRKLGRA